MAERHRSNDGTRETEAHVGEESTPPQQGRSGGNLERHVGTRDELRQGRTGRAGVTRPRKADEAGRGGLGGDHGTGGAQ